MADIRDAGALAAVGQFSIPWHGTVKSTEIGGVLYTGKLDAGGNEVTRPWPMPVDYDCWLVQVPGLPDPYAGEEGALRKEADALEGIEHTTWSILCGNGWMFGRYIGQPFTTRAWLWVDDNKVPWSVSVAFSGANLYTGPIEAAFTFTRFGDLREEGAPIEQHVVNVTLPDLGQSVVYAVAGLAGGALQVEDIATNGTKVIFGVRPDADPAKRIGFVEAAFTMPASGVPEVAFTVLANRQQALGTALNRRKYTKAGSEEDGGMSCFDADAAGVGWWLSFTRESEISLLNRIVAFAYDSDGIATPVLMSYESSYTEMRALHELLPGEPGIGVERAWNGPGASQTQLSCGAASVAASDSASETLFSEDLDAVVCTTLPDIGDGYPWGVTYEPQWTEDEGYLALYNMPDSSPTAGWGHFYPHRHTSKLFNSVSRVTGETFGLVSPFGSDPAAYVSINHAAWNPSTGQILHPIAQPVQFA